MVWLEFSHHLEWEIWKNFGVLWGALVFSSPPYHLIPIILTLIRQISFQFHLYHPLITEKLDILPTTIKYANINPLFWHNVYRSPLPTRPFRLITFIAHGNTTTCHLGTSRLEEISTFWKSSKNLSVHHLLQLEKFFLSKPTGWHIRQLLFGFYAKWTFFVSCY